MKYILLIIVLTMLNLLVYFHKDVFRNRLGERITHGIVKYRQQNK